MALVSTGAGSGGGQPVAGGSGDTSGSGGGSGGGASGGTSGLSGTGGSGGDGGTTGGGTSGTAGSGGTTGGGTGGATGGQVGTGGEAGVAGGCTGTPFYRDADSNGYGDPDDPVVSCVQPSGYVPNGDDCDDTLGSTNPGASELCNGIDDDCVDGADQTGVCPADCFGLFDEPVSYMLCTDGLPWSDAADACVNHGMHLVRIDSQAENDLRYDVADANSLGSLWTGGSDLALEGTWVWTDDTTFDAGGAAVGGAYVNWYTGEPSNTAPGEHCMTLRPIWNGAWNDGTCDSEIAYVCESD